MTPFLSHLPMQICIFHIFVLTLSDGCLAALNTRRQQVEVFVIAQSTVAHSLCSTTSCCRQVLHAKSSVTVVYVKSSYTNTGLTIY